MCKPKDNNHLDEQKFKMDIKQRMRKRKNASGNEIIFFSPSTHRTSLFLFEQILFISFIIICNSILKLNPVLIELFRKFATMFGIVVSHKHIGIVVAHSIVIASYCQKKIRRNVEFHWTFSRLIFDWSILWDHLRLCFRYIC